MRMHRPEMLSRRLARPLAAVLSVGLLAAMVTIASPAQAQDDGPAHAIDNPRSDVVAGPPVGDSAGPLGGDPGEELLIFQDMPIVVSASRQAQPMNRLSVPVSLVTAEDLHHSGLTTLPDILQFVPGVDVLRINRNRWAVGVRGLHEVFSDRLLTLVDGRAADSAIMGGPDFPALPTLIEDIERIEVVRGPAGAVWGANAFTGVVNIITKDPKDTQGWLLSTTVNHVGDSYSHVRYGGRADKWRYRASVGYEKMKSSEDAIRNDTFTSHDFARNWRFDGTAIYEPSDSDKWSLGWGQSHMELGANSLAGVGKETGWVEAGRGFARYDRRMDADTSGFMQWSGNFMSRTRNSAAKHFTADNALDGQVDFVPAEGHRTSIGANVRWVHIDRRNSNTPTKANYLSMPYDEYWLGAFVIDRFKASDDLIVEAQLRGDWYSETQCDWSSRLTGLYALDDDERHVVRLSGAKAFRAPLAVLRRGTQQHVPLPSPPFPPDLFGVNLTRPLKSLENEETWSVETGYTGKITKRLTVRTDAYYQRFEKLIGYRASPDPLALGRLFTAPANIDGANAYGAEVELALKDKDWKVSTWYAYNGFQPDQKVQTARAYLPAVHKVGVTGRLFLPNDWTLNANYRYTTTTSGHHLGALMVVKPGPTHRLDLTVAKKVLQGDGEVLLGVSDILNSTNDGTVAASGAGGHDVLGRTFFLRLQWSR